MSLPIRRRRRWALGAACAGLIVLCAGLLESSRDPAEEAWEHGLSVLDGEAEGDAMADFNQAVALAPSDTIFRESRASLLLERGDATGAVADLDVAVAGAPRPYLYMERGYARGDAGDLTGAKADFDAAIAGQPDNCQFYEARAFGQYAAGDLVGAEASMETAVTCDGARATSWRWRQAILLAELGRREEAAGLLDRIPVKGCSSPSHEVLFDGARELAALPSGEVPRRTSLEWRREAAGRAEVYPCPFEPSSTEGGLDWARITRNARRAAKPGVAR